MPVHSRQSDARSSKAITLSLSWLQSASRGMDTNWWKTLFSMNPIHSWLEPNSVSRVYLIDAAAAAAAEVDEDANGPAATPFPYTPTLQGLSGDVPADDTDGREKVEA